MKIDLPIKESWLSKIILMLAFLVTILPVVYGQGVAINTTQTPANPSAGLDVNFTNKGLLIPRVALSATTSSSPLTVHVAGMLVYNTATIGDVKPGLYFNNGTKWVSTVLPTGATPGMQYWDATAGTWVTIPVGTAGQKLILTAGGIPAWSN